MRLSKRVRKQLPFELVLLLGLPTRPDHSRAYRNSIYFSKHRSLNGSEDVLVKIYTFYFWLKNEFPRPSQRGQIDHIEVLVSLQSTPVHFEASFYAHREWVVTSLQAISMYNDTFSVNSYVPYLPPYRRDKAYLVGPLPGLPYQPLDFEASFYVHREGFDPSLLAISAYEPVISQSWYLPSLAHALARTCTVVR